MNADTVKLAFVLLAEAAEAETAARAAKRRAEGKTPLPPSDVKVLRTRWTQAETTAAIEAAEALQLAERRLRAINERDCNGYQTPRGEWDEAAQKRDEKRAEKIMAGVAKIGEAYSVAIRHNGDPRGAALKVATPLTGAYNGFGGREDGWAV